VIDGVKIGPAPDAMNLVVVQRPDHRPLVERHRRNNAQMERDQDHDDSHVPQAT
jgi:hypothetical protein